MDGLENPANLLGIIAFAWSLINLVGGRAIRVYQALPGEKQVRIFVMAAAVITPVWLTLMGLMMLETFGGPEWFGWLIWESWNG